MILMIQKMIQGKINKYVVNANFTKHGGFVMEHSERVIKSKEVLGVTVKNSAYETLGKIEDVVLEKITGHVAYVVLASDTILGMGGKYFALPWNAISYDPSERVYILDVDKAVLKSANGFDKDHWPDTADSTFARYTEKTY